MSGCGCKKQHCSNPIAPSATLPCRKPVGCGSKPSECPPLKDCDPCEKGKYETALLYHNDFKCKPCVGVDPKCTRTDFHFLTNSDSASETKFIANDVKFQTCGNGILALNSKTFTKTVDPTLLPGQLDWFKGVIYRNDTFPVPEKGELYYELTSATETYAVPKESAQCAGEPDWWPLALSSNSEIRNIINTSSDLRIAHFRHSLYDPCTKIELGFAITTKTIYAIHKRWPFGMTALGGMDGSYTAFSNVHHLQERSIACNSGLEDFARLGVGINAAGTARFYINDVLVHEIPDVTRITDPGNTLSYQPGATDQPPKPKCFKAGMGNCSELDGAQISQISTPPTQVPEVGQLGTPQNYFPQGLVKLETEPEVAYQNPYLYGGLLQGSQVALMSHIQPSPADYCEKVFGQGAIGKVKDMRISHRCDC